jgi:hypothetical protein
MTKVNDFSIQNKLSEENLSSEAKPEINKEPKCSKECPRFDSCSAPLCPMDIVGSIWYPDEEICTSHAFGSLLWIKNQKKISRKCRDLSGYFNLEMLSHNCQIKGGITGLDPDSTNLDDKKATLNWLRKHPAKREFNEAEKAELRRKFMENVRPGSTPIKKDAQSLQEKQKYASVTEEKHTTNEGNAKLSPKPHGGDIRCKNAV